MRMFLNGNDRNHGSRELCNVAIKTTDKPINGALSKSEFCNEQTYVTIRVKCDGLRLSGNYIGHIVFSKNDLEQMCKLLQ